MSTLAPQQIGLPGLHPTYAAASAGGDAFAPNDRTFLHVKNGAASPTTVTVVVPGTEYGQPRPDIPVVVIANSDAMIGPFSPDLNFADPVTGLVGITYSAVVTVTVAVISL